MMRIIELLQILILTVYSQGVLCQIIGSDGEEIHLPCKLPAHHHCCRCLYHDSLLRLPIFDFLRPELSLYFLCDFFDASHFLRTDNHGIHDCQSSKGGSTIQGPKLCLKNLGTFETNADSSAPQSRILLLLQPKILTLFIGADVQGTNNSCFSRHGLSYLFIDCKLFVLCRIGISL